jgi:hypothetical protein
VMPASESNRLTCDASSVSQTVVRRRHKHEPFLLERPRAVVSVGLHRGDRQFNSTLVEVAVDLVGSLLESAPPGPRSEH